MAQVNTAVLPSVILSHIHPDNACDQITHRVCFFVTNHLRRDRACVTPHIVPKIKITMRAHLASPYFNAGSKRPWGNTLFSCFMQSVIDHWRSIGEKNRYATLQTVSEIPDHLMKAFIFFGLHPSTLISFKCWNKCACLVLIVNRSWAELDTGPKGMGTETRRPSIWGNTNCSFRIATAWKRKPEYDPTSFFRKLCHMVPLYYQNICI